jgi:hypothetical protein
VEERNFLNGLGYTLQRLHDNYGLSPEEAIQASPGQTPWEFVQQEEP